MAYSVGSDLFAAWQMQSWIQVDAQLTSAGYERHSGDDSDTYEAYATYTYTFGGQYYNNDRVTIAAGADNIGDYQTDLGDRLSGSFDRGEPVVAYINPDNYADSIVDRSPRWSLLAFKSMFFLVFGGIGLFVLIFVIRKSRVKNLPANRHRDQPWLVNDDWHGAPIRSNSKMTMAVIVGFAIFWNLISAPLPFVIYAEVLEKQNYPALFGLLFPLVGIVLIIWAIRQIREWHRFGPAPVTLDPFPGSVGGHVGGTIDINLTFDASTKFFVTLTNLHSSVSGSGKDRRRAETPEWQDEQIAHATRGMKGTRISFRFLVPDGLDESDAEKKSETYYLWRLNIRASLDGVDIDRSYEIPVYATGASSQNLSDIEIAHSRSQKHAADMQDIQRMMNMTFDASGQRMRYPMGRNLKPGFSGLLFGTIFGSAGWYFFTYEHLPVFGTVFTGIGIIIVLSAMYFMLNSLEISQQGTEIRSVRRVLGIPIRTVVMQHRHFVKFENTVTSRTNSTHRHVVKYSVVAIDRNGQKMVVGEGFRGASQARAAADLIGQKFALVAQDDGADRPLVPEEENLLAAE